MEAPRVTTLLLQLDRSFDADYDVESPIDMSCVLTHGFHEPSMVPKPDLRLKGMTADGSSWKGTPT